MKMHLKNSKKKYLRKRFIIVIVCLVLFVYFFLSLSKNVSYYYLSYSEKEARKIIDLSVGNAITDDILADIKDKNLYKVSKNSKGEIEMVDYDSYLVNAFLRDITDNIALSLEKEESNPDKIAFYIPLGSIFQNPILNSKGPKIPVRMEIIGSVLTNINTKVTEYGINNCLIEMYVHVEVKEKVILPVIAKTITITNDLPVSYKIIKGTVPSYYGNSINKDSSIYSIPME
ncbi:MAG: sporulation protein YunB [Bacilli bacterium]